MASYARISPWESTVSAVHASFVEPYSPLTSPWRDALEKFLACDEFLWKSSSSKTFCGKWFVEHYVFLARNCWEMTNARTHVDTLLSSFSFVFYAKWVFLQARWGGLRFVAIVLIGKFITDASAEHFDFIDFQFVKSCLWGFLQIRSGTVTMKQHVRQTNR